MNKSIRTLRILLIIAMYAYAHWFFGNLYESVVTTPGAIHSPETILHETNIFAPGSPVRYYIPITVVGSLASVVALFVGWRQGRTLRQWLAVAAAFSLCSQLLTAYIVTQINLNLFFGSATVAESVAKDMLQRWQMWNILRLCSTAFAFLATLQVYRCLKPTPSAANQVASQPVGQQF